MGYYMKRCPDGFAKAARRGMAEVERARQAAAGKECSGNVPNTCRMAYADGQNFGGYHSGGYVRGDGSTASPVQPEYVVPTPAPEVAKGGTKGEVSRPSHDPLRPSHGATRN